MRFVLKFIRGSLGESTIFINCHTGNREKVKIILHAHVFDTRQLYTYLPYLTDFETDTSNIR